MLGVAYLVAHLAALWRIFGMSLAALWHIYVRALALLWSRFGTFLPTRGLAYLAALRPFFGQLWSDFGRASAYLSPCFGASLAALQPVCPRASARLSPRLSASFPAL